MLSLIVGLINRALGTTVGYNSKNYGVVGDGTVDDTTALQAAVTAAGNAGGGTVYFSGNVKTTAKITVPANVLIKGQGMFVSTITLAHEGSAFETAGAGVGLEDFSINVPLTSTTSPRSVIKVKPNHSKFNFKNIQLYGGYSDAYGFDFDAAMDIRGVNAYGGDTVSTTWKGLYFICFRNTDPTNNNYNSGDSDIDNIRVKLGSNNTYGVGFLGVQLTAYTAWSNGLAVTVGQRYRDTDLGTIWKCLVQHTTAGAGTFATDRAANPTYWTAETGFACVNNIEVKGRWVVAGTGVTGCVAFHVVNSPRITITECDVEGGCGYIRHESQLGGGAISNQLTLNSPKLMGGGTDWVYTTGGSVTPFISGTALNRAVICPDNFSTVCVDGQSYFDQAPAFPNGYYTYTLSAAAGTTNICNVTIRARNLNATNMLNPYWFYVYLSDDASGIGLTSTTPDGTVVAGATGTIMQEIVAKKLFLVQASSAGSFTLSITDSAKTAYRVCAVTPHHQLPIVSSALTAGNYGS